MKFVNDCLIATIEGVGVLVRRGPGGCHALGRGKQKRDSSPSILVEVKKVFGWCRRSHAAKKGIVKRCDQ